QRSRGHPGAAFRRPDDRDGRRGGTVGQHAARAALVAIHDLSTLGGAVSQGKAVNRRGQVVGTSRDALGRTRAFLWEETLGIVDLKPLTGVNTSANDINDNGEIVGGGDTGFGDFHAYVLSAGTSFDLGTLGGNESEALAVNRRGQVAGHSRSGAAPAKHAFVIAEPGTMIDLGTLGGATSIAHDLNDRANAINQAGCIVGASQTGDTDARGQPVTHAFLRTPDGGLLDLGTLGGEHSAALAVSEVIENVGAQHAAPLLWIAGHSHDASARMRAALWAVRLG